MSSLVQMSTSVSLSSFLQLNTLSRENKQLRRQLDEETSMRRQVERLLLLPSQTSQRCSSIHLPISLSAHPPPKSTSLPSFLRLPHPLSLDPATGDTDGIQTQTKLSGARPEWSILDEGACRVLCLHISGRYLVWEDKQGSDQMKPPEDFDLSWLFDPQLLNRELTQYEVNVLQVKVKSQGA